MVSSVVMSRRFKWHPLEKRETQTQPQRHGLVAAGKTRPTALGDIPHADVLQKLRLLREDRTADPRTQQVQSLCVTQRGERRYWLCIRSLTGLHKAPAGVFNLVVHHTGEARNGLLKKKKMGAAVRLNDISKASGHCGVPAVNTTAVPAPTAMVLVGAHKLPTYLPRCAFVRAGCGGARRVGGISLMAMDTRQQRSSASQASLLVCWRWAPVRSEV